MLWAVGEGSQPAAAFAQPLPAPGKGPGRAPPPPIHTHQTHTPKHTTHPQQAPGRSWSLTAPRGSGTPTTPPARAARQPRSPSPSCGAPPGPRARCRGTPTEAGLLLDTPTARAAVPASSAAACGGHMHGPLCPHPTSWVPSSAQGQLLPALSARPSPPQLPAPPTPQVVRGHGHRRRGLRLRLHLQGCRAGWHLGEARLAAEHPAVLGELRWARCRLGSSMLAGNPDARCSADACSCRPPNVSAASVQRCPAVLLAASLPACPANAASTVGCLPAASATANTAPTSACPPTLPDPLPTVPSRDAL